MFFLSTQRWLSWATHLAGMGWLDVKFAGGGSMLHVILAHSRTLCFRIGTALVAVGNPFGWQGLAGCQIRWWRVDVACHADAIVCVGGSVN